MPPPLTVVEENQVSVLSEVLTANSAYASSFGDKGSLALPPARQFAIRSLVISYKLLGTREWFVIHHSNCGMEFFTNDVMSGLLASSLETAALGPDGFTDVGKGPGSTEGKFINWQTISDNPTSVVEDVTRIRNHPLVPRTIPIYGSIYDVGTGLLVEVPEATEAGKAV